MPTIDIKRTLAEAWIGETTTYEFRFGQRRILARLSHYIVGSIGSSWQDGVEIRFADDPYTPETKFKLWSEECFGPESGVDPTGWLDKEVIRCAQDAPDARAVNDKITPA